MPRGVKVRDDGDGTVYQEGPNRWRAELVIDGKKVKRSSTTEKGAKAKLKELKALRDARLNVGDGKQLLREWIAHWLIAILPHKKGVAGGKVKPKTIEGHTYTCEHYILPYIGNHPLIRLSAQHIDEWQHKLREKGLSDGTIANARRRLSSALEAARKRKLVPENVVKLTDPPPNAPKRQTAGQDILNEGQVVTLLDKLHAENHRLYALYVLATTLGLRQAELMGLKWSAVSLRDGTLVVREQLQRLKGADGKRQIHWEDSPKNGKDRAFQLSPELVAVLAAHLARQRQEKLILGDAWRGEDLVFTSEDGTPLEAGALVRQFKRALRRAGLPVVTFHSLRKSAGSVMLGHGAQLIDVSKILGHSSVAVTAQWYAYSFDEGRKQAVAASASALLRRA